MFASAAASSSGLVLTRPRKRSVESRPLGEAKHSCQLVSPLTQQIVYRNISLTLELSRTTLFKQSLIRLLYPTAAKPYTESCNASHSAPDCAP